MLLVLLKVTKSLKSEGEQVRAKSNDSSLTIEQTNLKKKKNQTTHDVSTLNKMKNSQKRFGRNETFQS